MKNNTDIFRSQCFGAGLFAVCMPDTPKQALSLSYRREGDRALLLWNSDRSTTCKPHVHFKKMNNVAKVAVCLTTSVESAFPKVPEPFAV